MVTHDRETCYDDDYRAAMEVMAGAANEFRGLQTRAVLSALTTFLAGNSIILRKEPMSADLIPELGGAIARTIADFIEVQEAIQNGGRRR